MDDEFDPAAGTRSVLRWAQEHGATTLGEAYEMLEQFELSNDVPEVLGDEEPVESVREDVEYGLEVAGPDVPLTSLV